MFVFHCFRLCLSLLAFVNVFCLSLLSFDCENYHTRQMTKNNILINDYHSCLSSFAFVNATLGKSEPRQMTKKIIYSLTTFIRVCLHPSMYNNAFCFCGVVLKVPTIRLRCLVLFLRYSVINCFNQYVAI